MAHGCCFEECTVKLGICGLCIKGETIGEKRRNYCPVQEILQGTSYISIHLFIGHYSVLLFSIKLSTRSSKMNGMAPYLAGVPEM